MNENFENESHREGSYFGSKDSFYETLNGDFTTKINELGKQHYNGDTVTKKEDVTFGVEFEGRIIKDGTSLSFVEDDKGARVPANQLLLDTLVALGEGNKKYIRALTSFSKRLAPEDQVYSIKDLIHKKILSVELDGCQIEGKNFKETANIDNIFEELTFLQSLYEDAAAELGWKIDYSPVPKDMNFEPFPSFDVDGRYKAIHESLLELGIDIRRLTNITSIHIHAGKINLNDAIIVLNISRDFNRRMQETYNSSNRMELYCDLLEAICKSKNVSFSKDMVDPVGFPGAFGYLLSAIQYYGASKPSDIWYIMRATQYGTLEARYLDSRNLLNTHDASQIRQALFEYREHIYECLFGKKGIGYHKWLAQLF